MTASSRIYDRAGLSTESAVYSFPFVPSVDPSTTEDTRKFEMPTIEPTMNQSALLNTLGTDGRTDFPTAIINRDVEPYKALPESKEIGGVGLTHNGTYQSSQVWRPDSYSTQQAADYSSWKLQQQHYADNLRVRMEKLQVSSMYICRSISVPICLHAFHTSV